MITIKKYGNRRLYDTSRSSYINLEELTALVRAGEQVQVVDAKTGEDLTREVLLQIVMEVLRGADFFPTGMLRRLIRATGDDPSQRMLRQQLATGLQLMSDQLDRFEAMFPQPPVTPSPAPFPGARSETEPAGGCETGERTEAPGAGPEPADEDAELHELRDRLAALERRLKR